MRNFEEFVDEVVYKWRLQKAKTIESYGLGFYDSNREKGDLAEDYVVRKIKALSRDYICKKSKGSQSPSDIFSIIKIGRFWHIMLIQVKSSEKKDSIYKLNESEKKVLNEFAKFFKKELNTSEKLSRYRDKGVVISTGYAGVFNDIKNRRHSLKDVKYFNTFQKNIPKEDIIKLKIRIALRYKLLP